MIRLDKYLADMGIGTRSAVKQMIRKGQVTVNHETAARPELKINEQKDQVQVNGLFLAGGDTAMSFFKREEAEGSEIIGEVAAGIPLMKMTGGKHAGMKIVTKSGAFGNPDAIVYSLRKLKEA